MSNTPRRKSKAGTRTAAPKSRSLTVQQAGSPWPKRLSYLGGAVVVAVILSAVVFGGGDDDVPDEAPEGVEFITAGDPVHVDGDIDYGVPVPVGGNHNPIWQNCGFYDGPVRPENAVHAMEHGSVWITYRRDLGPDGIDDLESLVNNRRDVLVSEVAAMGVPLMATAWGVQLEMDAYDETPLIQFIRTFVDGPFAPEPAAGCTGGVGNPT